MATKDQKDKAWDNAATVRGKDPALYRKDPYGNPMYKRSYGKTLNRPGISKGSFV